MGGAVSVGGALWAAGGRGARVSLQAAALRRVVAHPAGGVRAAGGGRAGVHTLATKQPARFIPFPVIEEFVPTVLKVLPDTGEVPGAVSLGGALRSAVRGPAQGPFLAPAHLYCTVL